MPTGYKPVASYPPLIAEPQPAWLGGWDWPGVSALAVVYSGFAGPSAERAERDPDVDNIGYLGSGWDAAYYGRIHFSQPNIRLGVVGGRREIRVTLWNASLTAITLTGVLAVADDGIMITGFSLPLSIPPNAEMEFSVIVEGSGINPIIDASFTFETNEGPVGRLFVTGARGIIFAYPPDWSDTVRVSRRWETIRKTALSNRETRANAAARVLLSIEYSLANFSQPESARFARDLVQLRERPAGVAVWPDGIETAGPISAGATTITLAYAIGARSFHTGYVIIYHSPLLWAVAETPSSSGDTLFLTAPMAQSFPADTIVAPLCFGRITRMPSVEHITDQLTTARIAFEEQPN